MCTWGFSSLFRHFFFPGICAVLLISFTLFILFIPLLPLFSSSTSFFSFYVMGFALVFLVFPITGEYCQYQHYRSDPTEIDGVHHNIFGNHNPSTAWFKDSLRCFSDLSAGICWMKITLYPRLRRKKKIKRKKNIKRGKKLGKKKRKRKKRKRARGNTAKTWK